MAQEARVKVVVDVEDAKRSMDDVNQRLEKSRSLGSELASSVQGIARGAAAGIAMAGGLADQVAGGGLLPGLANTVVGALASAARFTGNAMGLDTGMLAMSAAEDRARARAIDAVKGLVGAGGDVSQEQIEGWIKGFTDLYRPGEQNIQKVNIAEQDMAAGTVARAFNSAEALNKLTDKLAELIVTIQQWSPFR